jgi:hypothetical protein
LELYDQGCGRRLERLWPGLSESEIRDRPPRISLSLNPGYKAMDRQK